MDLSKHNILSKIYNSDDFFIVNPLSGNADILSPDEAKHFVAGDIKEVTEYIEKGYVVDLKQEEKLFRQKYLDFLDDREKDEVQLFFVPWYTCNFACSYCYQAGYSSVQQPDLFSVTDAFFNHVTVNFKSRRKYITLFGGEPLLSGNNNRDWLEYFIENCRENNLELAVVTNGYELKNYIPVLTRIRIKEIQITLDGLREIHNKRRPLKGGQGTFDAIAEGIDAALDNGLPVNLRVVVDRENISELPHLAQFAIDKGWTKSSLFKTQLGRNYELHYCQSEQTKLYSRIDLYRDLYDILAVHPEILEFHKPAYSISKFLFENGELPSPLFDSCPGCKTEWAFDCTGNIYSCTATVGKPGEELGTFFPDYHPENEKIAEWQTRDVLSIKACGICNLRLACGGGCASVAKNSTGDLNSPDCRPVKELLEMGIALYSHFEEN